VFVINPPAPPPPPRLFPPHPPPPITAYSTLVALQFGAVAKVPELVKV
jgi:hypothetical protein